MDVAKFRRRKKAAKKKARDKAKNALADIMAKTGGGKAAAVVNIATPTDVKVLTKE